MSEDFLKGLGDRLVEGHADEVRSFAMAGDQDDLFQLARAWVNGCNPLLGGDLIEQRPLPAPLQAELNAFAISQRGSAIGNVPDGMCIEELCLAAVRQDGLAIESLPKSRLTQEICLEAVKQNGRAIDYVPVSMMTDEMRLLAGAGYV